MYAPLQKLQTTEIGDAELPFSDWEASMADENGGGGERDKAAFYSCGFVGIQDKLFDGNGRHFYFNCYIDGAIDFIFGFAKTVFERCHLHSTAGDWGSGYLTAQGRGSESDTGGYMFKYCIVTGTGPTYLGRAWNSYSRVVFYKSLFNVPITPAGWDAWNHKDFT
ncbi:putative pectinesterase 29 [Acorus calamus]|uniref:Pectinesterase n=1 Tax=Acorus calamus TaxID=4465 RepID=A0AAV9DNV5_ACOCL|nr:putative pectinesterase 29 [Acorus calamus]